MATSRIFRSIMRRRMHVNNGAWTSVKHWTCIVAKASLQLTGHLLPPPATSNYRQRVFLFLERMADYVMYEEKYLFTKSRSPSWWFIIYFLCLLNGLHCLYLVTCDVRIGVSAKAAKAQRESTADTYLKALYPMLPGHQAAPSESRCCQPPPV